mmetsp:Transcript_41780/g.63802  ORF Transcript_41780/g.63802 Transcript_41780/m.63802 type:complete len:141 (+) Transcript_41780:194-616(+)
MRKQNTSQPEEKKKSSTARLDNYTMLHSLGEGAYGQVNLAIEKKSGHHVAVKMVNIRKICQLNKDRHIMREKDLLDSLRFKHANIINLLSTFKDENNLYFVFEQAPNGSLDELIRNCRGQLGEPITKILFAQLVNFLEFI